MVEFLENTIEPHFNFWIYVILMMIGLWALIAKNNLIKKLIGLSTFQTAIILLYVSLGVKDGATIPILDHHGHEEVHSEHHLIPREGDEQEEGHEEERKGDDEAAHASAHRGEKAIAPASHPEKSEHGDEHGTGHGEDHGKAHDDSHDKNHGGGHEVDPDTINNPLPHVLMLTAIVVGVATLGVALSIAQMIYKEFGSLEEDEILKEVKSGPNDG
ncbi:MAG: NADH-quinone oxidoreductase subunit K [Verrucomicrobiota bacterium]